MKTLSTIICIFLISSSFAQKTAEEYYEIAKTDVEEESYRRSIKSYTKAIELDDGVAQYHFQRGRSYFKMGEFFLAKNDMDEALFLDSTIAMAYHVRGVYYFMTENYTASIEDNTKALAYSNDDQELVTACYLNRGEAKYLKKDTLGAYEDLKIGLEKDPENIGSLTVMCNVMHDLGKHEEALVNLDKLIELEPKEIGSYVNKGFELEALGKYEEAIEAYNVAGEIDGREPLVHSNRGHAYYMLKRYDEAMKDLNKSITNQPLNSFAYHTRALIFIENDNTDRACKDLEAAQAMGAKGEVRDLIRKYCR